MLDTGTILQIVLMKLEHLHGLVQGLSPQDRSRFSRYAKAAEGRKAKKRVILLYDRLVKYKVWNDQTSAKIKGKEFQDGNHFNTYQDRLLDQIIQSLASDPKGVVKSMAYLEVAIALRAPTQAGHALAGMMEEAMEKEDYQGLMSLHLKRQEIYDAYRIDLPLREGVMGYRECLGVCRKVMTLDEMIRRVVGQLKHGGLFVRMTMFWLKHWPSNPPRIKDVSCGTAYKPVLQFSNKT